jgi:hypothetical protein
VCGASFVGGESARQLVDALVAADMRGSGPHDRVCDRERSRSLGSSVARWLLVAVSRVAPRVFAPVRSPRRAAEGGGYFIVASAQQ